MEPFSDHSSSARGMRSALRVAKGSDIFIGLRALCRRGDVTLGESRVMEFFTERAPADHGSPLPTPALLGSPASVAPLSQCILSKDEKGRRRRLRS